MGSVLDFTKTKLNQAVSFLFKDSIATARDNRDCTLDELRRAAHDNLFTILFEDYQPDQAEEKLLSPDFTVRHVIKKLSNNVFKHGTTFTLEDKAANVVLQDFLKEQMFIMKLKPLVRESALMGYCGLRTVWVESVKRFITEIIPKEKLVIEQNQDHNEIIEGLSISFPYRDKSTGDRYWFKETWTNEYHYVWKPYKITEYTNEEPKDAFPIDKATISVNTYNEIPITIVPHDYDDDSLGTGVVRPDDILLSKCLIRLRNKRHYAHLEHMDPTLVRKNHADTDQPVRRGVGAVIDISDSASDAPADAFLLEYSGLPESVRQEIYEGICDLYENAGLTPPSEKDAAKVGTTDVSSGIALQIRDHGEAETIETLRGEGYSFVISHLEKVIRMLAATRKKTEYTVFTTDKPAFRKLIVTYPSFFPPTDDDVTKRLSNLDKSHLPAEEKAKREAQIFGITDDKLIKEIEGEIEHSKELLEQPTNPNAIAAPQRPKPKPKA